MIGKTISRYTITEKLGAGGMGEVYLADDAELNRRVAIKVLPPGFGVRADMLERFRREAKAAAALNHPNIITVYDVGTHEERPYIVMEYVNGEPLAKAIERKDLSIDRTLEIAAQIFEGLSAAHEAGVIHRDVKPGNILIDATGRVLIVDFGLARLRGAVTVTASEATVGTVHYMSPEQARGEKLDPRSDLFAAGVVLYEMVAGERPFPGEHREAVFYAITSIDPKPLRDYNHEAAEGLERIVTRLLAKEREKRYVSAKAVLEDLHREHGTAMSPATARRRRDSNLASRRALGTLAAVIVLIAVAAVAAWQVWWPFGGGPASPPGPKDWILVAEFESPPGDSTVAQAAQSLLSSALDQSQIVTTVPRDQILQALEAAGKPKTTRVDAQVAKELAYRSSVRSVLEGTIGRLGKGYSIVVNVTDAENAKLILTKSSTAKDDDALIPAIGEMSKELRAGLGEQRSALKATRPMNLVATPSFEAYKLYAQGARAYNEHVALREALRWHRAALAVDPDFASAWLAASIPYQYLGYPDSARICLDEAARRPERLAPQQRLYLELRRASLDGDDLRVLAVYDRRIAENPEDWSALGLSNDTLWRLGRIEEALERTRKYMRLAPFGPSAAGRSNEVASLMWLGRFDEAREANEHMTGSLKTGGRVNIELAAGQFAVAESIAVANLDDPQVVDNYPDGFRWELVSCQFGRGAVGATAATLKDSEEIYRRAHIPYYETLYRRRWIEFSVVSDGVLPLPRDAEAPDTTATGLLTRGLKAAVTRDQATARGCLDAARARPSREIANCSAAPPLLEARIEAMAGRPEQAVRILQAIAGRPRYPMGPSLTWVHWWLADAYEQMDRPDSAAVSLERIFPVAFSIDDGAQKPYVHRRLAVLYAHMGRLVAAEQHLAAAEQAWDRPDPEVRRMLDEAREAVRYAREMAQPERKRL